MNQINPTVLQSLLRAFVQHGQRVPSQFAGQLQTMPGQQQAPVPPGMLPGIGQLPDPATNIPGNDPRNSQMHALRRQQMHAGLEAQRQKASLRQMDKGYTG